MIAGALLSSSPKRLPADREKPRTRGTQMIATSIRSLATQVLGSLLLMLAGAASVLAQTGKDADWARVTEDDRAIKIETGKLEAVIPKKNPKQWMTGIEKGSFLDKT